MASFREINKGEQLISKLQNHTDIFILFKGKLKFSKYSLGELELEEEEKKVSDMFYNREHFKEVDPIATFGSLDALTSSESKHNLCKPV